MLKSGAKYGIISFQDKGMESRLSIVNKTQNRPFWSWEEARVKKYDRFWSR